MRTRIALAAAPVAVLATSIIGPAGASPQRAADEPARAASGAHSARGGTSALADFHRSGAIAAEPAGGTSPPSAPALPAPPPPPPAPVPAPPTDGTSTATSDWQCIRVHESGDEYANPGRPSGAYGILLTTWHAYGMTGWPYQAPPGVQDAFALNLYHRFGWAPWSTRVACGLG